MATQINLDNSTRVDVTCRKGDTFNLKFTFTDSSGTALDISGYTWKLDVKETDTSSSDIIGDSSFTYVGNASGELTISATAAVMAAVNGGMYVYDLQSTTGGEVKTWIYGFFTVNEDISE
jgi:hypothetical protein